jgi:hypothetical protein
MLPAAESGTPVDIPPSVHLILWPALLAWLAALVYLRRTRHPLCSSRLAFTLVPLTFLADAAVLVASLAWPAPASNSLIFGLLWVAVLLSVTTYILLRASDDGDDGGSEEHPGPEPPWWPEFERRFRDYARDRPRRPSSNPRSPAGTSA